MAVDIRLPKAGDSITEAFIGQWQAKEGTWVDVDQNIVVIETEKAAFDVPAPVAGILTKILKKNGEKALVNEVIAQIEPAPRPANVAPAATAPNPAAAAAPAPASAKAGGHVMPAAAAAAAQSGIDASSLKGSGPGGRILKEDVQKHASSPAAAAGVREERRQPMSILRQTIARRLVEAQHNAALLTTFNECDVSAIKKAREQYQDAFSKKYGIKLGFMSFFVKAVVDALNLFPAIGARIDGTDLVYRNYCDIGVAIGSGRGLVVPILRSAERMSFSEIELAIADFAKRANEGRLSMEEMEGGTFTISNGGVYGSLLSTPIVNPPQSGVLGMHNIVDRAIVVNGEIVIRPMMYLALTYDHRVVDGREAVSFLKRIKDIVEDPTRLVLEI
ncbi:MAG: 2-oxoglutarate dehydrogenase complex dihydrolipoyllysine-residue succinyltransferase [Planctomycetota bacterium]|nr:MAG: 2-oxoglutarate dehydrogenase complex dihydrolipoyllysine-residue succinyltransferase [Planctomycetota bacterium]